MPERVGSPAPTPPAEQTRSREEKKAGRQACGALRQLVQKGEGPALPSPRLVLRRLFADSPSFSDAMAVWDQSSVSYPRVARHPCTPPASATRSVAARSPAPSPATQSVAARPPTRAVNMSWLSCRSDKEMEEQIETALYEPMAAAEQRRAPCGSVFGRVPNYGIPGRRARHPPGGTH